MEDGVAKPAVLMTGVKLVTDNVVPLVVVTIAGWAKMEPGVVEGGA